jgi:V8-like Glu-specific endopeptidase
MSDVQTNASLYRVARRTTMTLLLVCSTAGCTDHPTALDRDEVVATGEQSIIGGTTDTGDPSIVALRVAHTFPNGDTKICSGTVISPIIVLTAAHCVDPRDVGVAATFEVLSGPDISNALSLPVRRTLSDPLYDDNNFHYDAGVVELLTPTSLAPVPYIAGAPTSSSVRIIGYGSNMHDNTGAGIKRQATTEIVSTTPETIVIGNSNTENCHGDSGGPILQTIDGRERIVAIQSLSKEMDQPPFSFCNGGGIGSRADISSSFINTNAFGINPTWDQWRPVPDGATRSGVTVAAIAVGGGRYSLFVVGTDNAIYTNTGSSQTGWDGWTRVGTGLAGANASITALPIGFGNAVLFVVGTNGLVYTSSGSAATGWTNWPNVGTRLASPGTSIAAVPNGGQFTLFMVGADKGIYTTTGSGASWPEWVRVGTGEARPGTSVTAVSAGSGLFGLFVIGTDGHIYTSTGSPQTTWSAWPPVGTGVAHANATRVTALAAFGQFNLFVLGTDATIHTSSGAEQSGWSPWPPVGTGVARSDSSVTAVPYGNGQFALFVVGTDDLIHTSSGSEQTEWTPWPPAEPPVGIGIAGPGSSVTAVRIGAGFTLFVPDPSGVVRASVGP